MGTSAPECSAKLVYTSPGNTLLSGLAMLSDDFAKRTSGPLLWNDLSLGSYFQLKLRDRPLRAPGRCCFRGLSMRLVSLWWELPPWLTSNTRI
jgi:hypothetical protein